MERIREAQGGEWFFKTDEFKHKSKETLIRKYHVEHISQLPETIQKMKLTCLNKYGVENYSQTSEFQQKCHKKYTNEKYPDITFGSSWEFKVYDFLIEHNIVFIYQPSISFEYEYKGTIYTYHPDFKIGDKIFEVKGDYFFRINESSGKEEMFCPYRYDDWSDEHYNWMCGKYEAKHQCMIKNNVVILKDDNIVNLNLTMFDLIT